MVVTFFNIYCTFTAIPCWEEANHPENNWSGKRRQLLPSMPAILSQDPDFGLIDYGDTDVSHKDHDAAVLTFLDFYNQGKFGDDLKYLVFDSSVQGWFYFPPEPVGKTSITVMLCVPVNSARSLV